MDYLEITLMLLIGWNPLLKTLKSLNKWLVWFFKKHDNYITNKIIPIAAIIHWVLGISCVLLYIMIISLQAVTDVINGHSINTLLTYSGLKGLFLIVIIFTLDKILIRSDKKLRLQLVIK